MRRTAWAIGIAAVIGLLWVSAAWRPATEDHASALESETPAEAKPPVVDPAPARTTAPAATAPTATANTRPPAPELSPTAAVAPPTQPARTHQFAASGRIAELKGRFESEPRASAASEPEGQIRAAFAGPGIPPELFRSVLCRQSVCKVEMRWTPDRMAGYFTAYDKLPDTGFKLGRTGAAPTSEPGDDGVQSVELYIERKP